MDIRSAVVSQVVPVGFADLAEAADLLPGAEVSQGRNRLKVEAPLGAGLAGAVRFGGSLRTSALLPAIKVEVVVSPWSAGHSEVAIHPVTGLRRLDSARAERFYRSALSVLPALIDHLGSAESAEASVLELAA